MAINSPRLGLRVPGFTDPENVVTDINNNLDKIDNAVNANTLTSSTRPISPYHGRMIYETDTKLVAIFIAGTGPGSGWNYIGGDGYARGKRAVITSDVNSTGTLSNVEIGPFISITFTAEANRRYWVESAYGISFSGGSGAGSSAQVRTRAVAGGTVTTAAPQLGSDAIANACYNAGTTQDFWQQFEYVPNINGNVTVGLFISTASATKTIKFDQNTDRSAFLLARDVGST